MYFGLRQTEKVTPERALAGRSTPVVDTSLPHAVLVTRIGDTPAGSEIALVALGCYWGAEKLFWQTEGVTNTAVGFAGGYTPNPTYDETCSGRTGHTETVRVAFDPARVSYDDLLAVFFENHDPTQGNRQGNDLGSQYRSAIFTTSPDQQRAAEAARDRFQAALTEAGYGTITTEIEPAGEFWFAEAEHQQYLHRNPAGYCPVHATGVTCR